jgi:hypothetical protein
VTAPDPEDAVWHPVDPVEGAPDEVAGSPGDAVSIAMAMQAHMEQQTHGAGSVLGTVILPSGTDATWDGH